VRYEIVSGLRTLWHVSDDPAIARFEPRAVEHHDSQEPLVWAIDDLHVPAYWFPRECPRATFWAKESTSDDDVDRFLGGDRGRRVHAIQTDWLDTFRSARVFAYRLPAGTFELYPKAAGYAVSREPVEPEAVEELDDLLAKHAQAGIELRVVPDLMTLHWQVVASTLEFSGIRLRNLESYSSQPPYSPRRPSPKRA
jgi:hypothetical protein